MLKRYQVLLASWQADYLKYLAEKYDVSFSEAIRAAVSLAIMCTIPKVYPEYKPSKPADKLSEVTKKGAGGPDEVEVHKLLSNLYFEARKAAEYSLSKGAVEKHAKKIFS
jgi:hypothetical protein